MILHKRCINTPAIKYLKVVIPRLDRSPRRLARGEGIQKGLDTPIKSEYDMFRLFHCRCNNMEGRHAENLLKATVFRRGNDFRS